MDHCYESKEARCVSCTSQYWLIYVCNHYLLSQNPNTSKIYNILFLLYYIYVYIQFSYQSKNKARRFH